MSRNTFEPYIRTPISDMLGPVVSSQRKPCRDFELRLNKCKEAFGKTMGEKKCMDYLEDYNECCNQFKQTERVIAMKREARRQYAAGERKELYDPVPKADSY